MHMNKINLKLYETHAYYKYMYNMDIQLSNYCLSNQLQQKQFCEKLGLVLTKYSCWKKYIEIIRTKTYFLGVMYRKGA